VKFAQVGSYLQFELVCDYIKRLETS